MIEVHNEIWDALVPVHRAVAQLRPILDYSLVADETEEFRKQPAPLEFRQNYNDLRDLVGSA